MNIQKYWYQSRLHPLLYPLIPLTWIFQSLVFARRVLYRLGIKKTIQCSIPVIVVGNISMGGTGKTPFVIWLATYLKKEGKKPGIVLRGVGGKKQHRPSLVTPHSNPAEIGDEAVLLAQQTHCPVVACIDRVAAVNQLAALSCDIAISDDGLQHYRLARDIEIAIIDGHRFLGNRFLFPAGPLREPVSRLKKIDLLVVNQSSSVTLFPKAAQMRLVMESFAAIHDKTQGIALSAFSGKTVHAVAGIGNPQRFFEMLKRLNIHIIPHVFPDHHLYQTHDLCFQDDFPIIMTEKDAVKCRLLKQNEKTEKQQWSLQIQTEVPDSLGIKILSLLTP